MIIFPPRGEDGREGQCRSHCGGALLGDGGRSARCLFHRTEETYLNVRGLDNVLTAIHHVFASLYNDRAIAYRVHHNFQHHEVALSAGIQRMARSVHHRRLWPRRDRGAGRCQSRRVLHLQAGARRRQAPILSCKLGSKAIKMIYGDSAAHGKTTKTVEVDEADRMRFCLTDEQLLDLARQAMIIEKHYGHPMDIEWALDGTDGKVYIVQARPETVKSRSNA